MSQANTQQSGSSEEQSEEPTSGIIITHRPGAGDNEPSEPEPEPEPEEVEEVEADPVEEEPDVVEEGESNEEVEDTASEESSVEVEDEENSLEESEDAAVGTETTPEQNDQAETEAEVSGDSQDEESEGDASSGNESESLDIEEVNSVPQQFEAVIDSGLINSVIDSVGVLVDECKIRMSPEGIQIRAVDPANVGMVDLSLTASGFESFDANTGVIGLDLNRLSDVVSLASSGDLVKFELDEETRKLHIRVDGLEYTLALIDPDSIRQEPSIPDLDLPCTLLINSNLINQSLKAADMVSDHIQIEAERGHGENFMTFHADGDTDDVNHRISDSEDTLESIQIARDSASLFSLDYLKDMNKAFPTNEMLEVELGDEFPVKVHYSEEAMDVTFMLAPRIQSD